MKVSYACNRCETELFYSTRQDDQPGKNCPNCGNEFDLHPNFRDGDNLHHCLLCGGEDFYTSKQINPNFGFAMVVLGGVGFLASVYFIAGLDGFLWGMVVLLSLAVIDRVLRMVLPEAVICYRCSSVYYEVDSDQEFGEFDHELATHLKFSDE